MFNMTKEKKASGSQSTSELAIKDLCKSYDGTSVVNNVNLDIPQGNIFTLLGPSGGGKTTTLRMIAGFEKPDSGLISIGGEITYDASTFVSPEHRKVGMVFQDYALFPHLNVYKNVSFGVNPNSETFSTIDALLETIGISELKNRMPYELSGGQQQRVALARALAPKPRIVALDEPFSNLDTELRQRVRNEIRQIIKNANVTTIFVTHDQDEAFAMADTVGIMLQNTLAQVGTPQQVYADPESLDVAKFLGDVNIIEGRATGNIGQCDLGKLTLTKKFGHDEKIVIAIKPESIRLHSESADAIRAKIVSVKFRGTYKTVDLALPSGKILTSNMGIHINAEQDADVAINVNSIVSAFPKQA
ncbi:MAG: ABC transporter ATP-binding protein [SAR202 cluster bacterium]|nr:ABC transporter ATP-binding protein [SAR202 cluster bacterium]|tara:strand:+ start:9363 stop:10442 length:1080 start_codon:yes stop_codon:yes gene_type:complete